MRNRKRLLAAFATAALAGTLIAAQPADGQDTSTVVAFATVTASGGTTDAYVPSNCVAGPLGVYDPSSNTVELPLTAEATAVPLPLEIEASQQSSVPTERVPIATGVTCYLDNATGDASFAIPGLAVAITDTVTFTAGVAQNVCVFGTVFYSDNTVEHGDESCTPLNTG